ncbi:MAG: SIMPL domain-containing protein [Chloroflexi bacterium]|nr:SIMPL domain-containing protein [Chloroflexota bacterium]
MNTKRTRTILAVMLVLAVSVMAAGCAPQRLALAQEQGLQAASQLTGPVRTINVAGSGIAYGDPDVAYVTIGVSSMGEDAAKTIEENNTTLDAVNKAIQATGIMPADIQTTSYMMWVETVTDYDGRPTGVTRLHVDNMLQVTVRDPKSVGALITKAIEAGANSVNSISFGVLDPSALQGKAREAAIKQARERAELLAKGFGLEVGDVVAVTEGVTSQAQPFFDKLGMGGAMVESAVVPVETGQLGVGVSIEVTFLVK